MYSFEIGGGINISDIHTNSFALSNSVIQKIESILVLFIYLYINTHTRVSVCVRVSVCMCSPNVCMLGSHSLVCRGSFWLCQVSLLAVLRELYTTWDWTRLSHSCSAWIFFFFFGKTWKTQLNEEMCSLTRLKLSRTPFIYFFGATPALRSRNYS